MKTRELKTARFAPKTEDSSFAIVIKKVDHYLETDSFSVRKHRDVEQTVVIPFALIVKSTEPSFGRPYNVQPTFWRLLLTTPKA